MIFILQNEEIDNGNINIFEKENTPSENGRLYFPCQYIKTPY